MLAALVFHHPAAFRLRLTPRLSLLLPPPMPTPHPVHPPPQVLQDEQAQEELWEVGTAPRPPSLLIHPRPMRRRLFFARLVGIYSSLACRGELGELAHIDFDDEATWPDDEATWLDSSPAGDASGRERHSVRRIADRDGGGEPGSPRLQGQMERLRATFTAQQQAFTELERAMAPQSAITPQSAMARQSAWDPPTLSAPNRPEPAAAPKPVVPYWSGGTAQPIRRGGSAAASRPYPRHTSQPATSSRAEPSGSSHPRSAVNAHPHPSSAARVPRPFSGERRGIAAPATAGESSGNKGGTASGPILGAAGTSSRPTSGSAGASSHPISGASSRSISEASLRSIYGTAGASSRPISDAGVPSSVGDGCVPGGRVATGAGLGLSARDRGGGMGGISSGAEVVEIAPDDAAAVPAVRLPLPHNLEPLSPCRLAASASMPALAARAGPNTGGEGLSTLAGIPNGGRVFPPPRPPPALGTQTSLDEPAEGRGRAGGRAPLPAGARGHGAKPRPFTTGGPMGWAALQ